MIEVHRGALLEEDPELFVELVVAIDAVLGFVFEELEEALGDDLVQLIDEGFVLHRLARDVEREIFAINDTLGETQPLGQQILGLGIDHHLAAIERYAGLETGETHLLAVALGNEEQGVDRKRSISREMQT